MSGNKLPSKSMTSASWIEDATLTGILDSHTLAHPPDERTIVRENLNENTNTILREIESDPDLKAIMSERTMEPLMQLPKDGDDRKGINHSSSAKHSILSFIASATDSPSAAAATAKAPSATASKDRKDASKTMKPPAKPRKNAQSTGGGGGASSAASKKKAGKDTAQDLKQRATRSAVSAFMHLHQPTMTAAEQAAFLKKYEGREIDMWRTLAERFGKQSVPERLMQSAEESRGSVRIQLSPKTGDLGKQTIKSLKDWSIDNVTRETVSRTTTVKHLLRVLQLRWEVLDDQFQEKGCDLYLYAVGSDIPLSHSAIVRDCVTDGCLEYAWSSSSPDGAKQVTMEEESWGNEHSLAAPPDTSLSFKDRSYAEVSSVGMSPESTKQSNTSPEGKSEVKKRRIQPIPVGQEASNKRIQAHMPSTSSPT